MYQHGRFALQPGLQLFVLWSFLEGGAMLWLGVPVYAALFLLLDDLSGDDFETPQFPKPAVLNLFLYATFILTVLLTVVLIYLAGTFEAAWLEVPIEALGSIDIAGARTRTGGVDLAGGAIALGIVCSAAAGNSGHELVHRRHRRIDWALGHWLLAVVFDTTLAVEHVFGHHSNVGLAHDPATAQRGVSFWRFMPRAIVQANINAWRHETKRLGDGGRWQFHRNQVVRGHFKSVLIAIACFVGAGGAGLAVFATSAVSGRLIIELFNYCGHYGLVRVPGRPVRPRHSWNSFRRLSTSLMFNLPRHAGHHLIAGRAYWQLRREPDGPVLPHGIAPMAAIAAVPPLWFRVMAPKIAEWDRDFASDAERILLSGTKTDI